MKQMKKVIQKKHERTNGQSIKEKDLNEWGYPNEDKFYFAGCTTTHLAIPETETLVITHTNKWVLRKVEHKKNAIHVFDAEQFAKELKEAYDERQNMTVADLKEECRVLGLKVGGKKADLIARLDAHYATLRGEEE